MASPGSKISKSCGYDFLLGSIAALYVVTIPYTKVEESFNVQAIHDMLFLRRELKNYDHFEFPGVVPRTFIGSMFIAFLTSPVAFLATLLKFPKIYTLVAARLLLAFTAISSLRFLRIQIRAKFGRQVEGFFFFFTAIEFHLLFYCSRPLPNTFALNLIVLAYGYWVQGNCIASLRCMVVATAIFRCDMLLLLFPLGFYLVATKSVTPSEIVKRCVGTSLSCVVITVLVDSFMWGRFTWPELEVLWFNSVMNRSSEWGTQPFHWYFTNALPRALLVAYPLFWIGFLLDARVRQYATPIVVFLLLYSKLPHKELRFVIASVPVCNLSAAVAASRIYANRKKRIWNTVYLITIGLIFISGCCTAVFFVASYHNYPGGYAMRELGGGGVISDPGECWVHVDSFSAMNGVSRFGERGRPWRYSKEEGISPEELRMRNFSYLLNERSGVPGFDCLFSVDGFSGLRLTFSFPPLSLVKRPKVFVHANAAHDEEPVLRQWPGCS